MNPPTTRFRFQRLEVWQEAGRLNQDIDDLTRTFPKEELSGLTSQMRRSSRSVAATIAEGAGRNSDTDFRQFIAIADGSAMALASGSLACDRGWSDREIRAGIVVASDPGRGGGGVSIEPDFETVTSIRLALRPPRSAFRSP